MRDGQPAIALELAEVAGHRRLAIYAGAGLSRARPTAIPDGPGLAELCRARLADILAPQVLNCEDPPSLTSLADAAAAAGAIDLVRRTAIAVARFRSARPNFGHEVLALLLLEGMLAVVTTNWDDCIERAAGEERILTIISTEERLQIQEVALLKVHGCSTRPPTMLLTTDDLETPPVWVREAVNALLSDSHTVFVGIGDVAPYVRARIREAKDAVGDGGTLLVVAPHIHADWTGSHWRQLLPDLPADRRIAATADEFLDQLAAAYVRRTLRETFEALCDERPAADAFDKARQAFDAHTSIEALRWLRCCCVPLSPGTSAMGQQAFTLALIALGRLADRGEVIFLAAGRARVADVEYEVLTAVGTVTATTFRREAENRLVRYRSAGRAPSSCPRFLVAGAVGRLQHSQHLSIDVLDDSDAEDDLISGPLLVTPTFVHAEDHQP